MANGNHFPRKSQKSFDAAAIAPSLKQQLVEQIKASPKQWVFTPVAEKRPNRPGWQSENLPRFEVVDLIKRDARYTGFGLITGTLSGGLIALDVDGASAEPVLRALADGDYPDTVCWTSGKTGRKQLLYKISEEYLDTLKDFTRCVITEVDSVVAEAGEQLELRYNSHQSVLPPSIHPETGSYKWIKSPVDIEVAIAPQWLIDAALHGAKVEREAKLQKQARRALQQTVQEYKSDDSFDIRNFQHLLDGYSKGRCCCPHHNGQSSTSLSIDQDTGAFHCFNQCSSKDVYYAALKLAISRGYPDPRLEKTGKRSEPSYAIALDAADRRQWEQDSEELKQEIGRELSNYIRRQFSRPTWKQFKRTGKLPPTPKLNPKTDPRNQPYKYAKDGAIALYDPAFAKRRWVIEVTPETVPSVQDWELAGCPRLVFNSAFSVDVLGEMVDLGYRTILFDAIVGAGKSHIAGELLARWRQFQTGQEDPELAYYLANDYRNPPTPTLEDLPETVTGGALIVDHEKLTPGGNPYRRRPTKAQQDNPDIAATCIEDATIQKARSRGIDIQRGHKSEFCRNGCWLAGRCEYLREKKQQELEPVLRSHPTNALRAGRFAIVDEAGQSIATTRSTSIKLEDLDTERGRLARLNGYLSAISESVLKALTQGITRAIEERDTRHGLTDAEVRQFLPSAEQLLELSISETWLQSSDIWGETTSLEKLALRIQQVTQPDIEEVFQFASTPEDKQRRIDDLFTTSGYANLLTAIAGNKHDIRITPKGKIVITKRDRRVAQNLAKFNTVILMDATPDPSHLARQLGRPAKSFVRISTYKPRFDNGAITSIVGFGQARNQRGSSEEKYIDSQYSVENRAVRLVEALCNRHSGESIGLIDYKNWLPKYDFLKDRHNIVTGAEYVDSRGSNLFKNCDVLILVAKPVENLGSLLTEWHLLTGESCTVKSASKRFWSWVNRRSLHELLQGIGRTRLQYRNRPIQIYLVSEISEFDTFEIAGYFPGIKIKQENIFSICPAAAAKGEQAKHKVLSSIWRQIKDYGIARAAQTATDSGISRGRVSQIVRELDTGFKALTKSLDLLYKASYRETKLSDLDLSPETLFLAQTYLPEVAAALERQEITQQEALQEFINLAESCGADTFRKVVALTPIDAIATIFNRAIAYLLSFDIGPIPWEIPPPTLQQMEVLA